MCGICGIAYHDPAKNVEPGTLKKMTETLRFRGPDGEGVYHSPGLALGHRRLGVIDLEGGHQPMRDATGNFVVSFNGEIYNFLELRKELEREGVRFKTRSDTEVLIEAYARWGIDSFQKFAGMFAFALWDAKNETLILCRDRLGVKPLYYSETEKGTLVFGSELSTVLAHPEVKNHLNHSQFLNYLAFSYTSGSDSSINNVHKLAPAHFLIWKRGKPLQIHPWWDLAKVWQNAQRDNRSDASYLEEFTEILSTAVKQRLISDVPLGAFLSGGLDSTCITQVMKSQEAKVETFSIGFQEESYDELPWARMAASEIGTNHFDQVVRGSDPELLLELSSHQDEPFADTSVVATYALCKMARSRVTVALTGDGADELLGGYVTQAATALQNKMRHLPNVLLLAAQSGVSLLPENRNKVNWVFKAKRFFSGVQLDPIDAHASWRMLASGALLNDLCPKLARGSSGYLFEPFRNAFSKTPHLNNLDRFLYVDYLTWLVDDILVKTDRTSMAHGLELRSPFLDHRLVEFCAGLPTHLKRRNGKGKILLRNFAEGKIPTAIINRKKAGFNSPVSHWIAGAWSSLFDEYLNKHSSPLDKTTVLRLKKEHTSGQHDHGYLLFNILMGLLWLERIKPRV